MVGKLTPNNLMSASRIPQLLGLSPYATQNQLLSEMIDHDQGKAPEPWEGNELTTGATCMKALSSHAPQSCWA